STKLAISFPRLSNHWLNCVTAPKKCFTCQSIVPNVTPNSSKPRLPTWSGAAPTTPVHRVPGSALNTLLLKQPWILRVWVRKTLLLYYSLILSRTQPTSTLLPKGICSSSIVLLTFQLLNLSTPFRPRKNRHLVALSMAWASVMLVLRQP